MKTVVIPIEHPNFTNRLTEYAKKGFSNPFISDRSPKNKPIPHSVILKFTDSSNFRKTLIAVRYLLKQYKRHGCCSMRVKFSEKAIEFLRKTSRTAQKELTGPLHIERMTEKDGDCLFVIGVDKKRVSSGSEEEVVVKPTRYNFHSHPEDAYLKYNVKNAWPSLTDYLGLLILGNNTIFHCVATLEGVYVMSFSEEWVEKLDKVDEKFVRAHYNINHAENLTPMQYTRRVNHIPCQGAPIFIVKFLPWGESVHTIFSVNYKKEGLNCRF